MILSLRFSYPNGWIEVSRPPALEKSCLTFSVIPAWIPLTTPREALRDFSSFTTMPLRRR